MDNASEITTKNAQQTYILTKRDEAFPDHWWEPRLTDEEGLVTFVDKQVGNIKQQKMTILCCGLRTHVVVLDDSG